MHDDQISDLSARQSQAELDHLLTLFKQVITNIVKQSKVGNFVDIEATYNNFIKHNKDAIASLDVQDKQNFIQQLCLMFVQSVGIDANDQQISDLINNSGVLDDQTTVTEPNPSSGTDLNNILDTNNSVLNETADNLQVDKPTSPVMVPNQTSSSSFGVNSDLRPVKPSRWMFNQYKTSFFNVQNNQSNQQINTKTLTWFGKLRYFLYKFTSISANSGRFSFALVCAMIYNIIILGMALSSLTPIIATIAHIGWTAEQVQLRNYYINRYGLYMFAFAWCLILDWIIRLSYADFSNPYVSTKKAFLSYLFSISNLYQLASVIAVITILFLDGKNWTQQVDTNSPTKQIVTILFLLNTLVVIPRFAENFFFGKNLLLFKKIMKSKWKVVLGAVVALVILLLIFSFAIYETESAYYIQQGWLNPQTGSYDLDAFTHGLPFQSIWQALWYSFVTITTIGYGDYVPYSTAGKIIAVFLAVVGISYFTFIMGILVNIFTDYSSARKNDENRLKEIQEKNNQLKQYNYLHQLIVNDFVKAGLISSDKLDKIRAAENQHLSKASDILDEVEINNRGNLVWNNQQLGTRIYNNKDIKSVEQAVYKPINVPNTQGPSNLIYSFDDQYLRRILRYKHFSVLITKLVGTTEIDQIFICKEHFNREVYACLKVAVSVIMPKQLAYDAYVTFSQFEGKLQYDSCFKDDDCVQISLISEVIPFPKLNRLSQYGLNIHDFTNYQFLTQDNNEPISN